MSEHGSTDTDPQLHTDPHPFTHRYVSRHIAHTHAHTLSAIHPSVHTCTPQAHTPACSYLLLLTSRGPTHALSCEHTNTCTDTDKHRVTGACACHTHMVTSLSVVILGTTCLAQRQTFREGVWIEWTPRMPEMNCEVENCLLAFK